jgi:RNA recognition motif-containing protein
MFIPRPDDFNSPDCKYSKDSLGKAFVEFEDLGASFAVYNLMNNRIFNGRPVEVTFYEQNSFNKLKG